MVRTKGDMRHFSGTISETILICSSSQSLSYALITKIVREEKKSSSQI